MLWVALAISFAGFHSAAYSQDVTPNLKSPTFGGLHYWSDVVLYRDWRIQRHSLTEHCRLLDGHDLRHAWGTRDECRAKLAEIRRERNLPPMEGTAVLLLHGFLRSRSTTEGLAEHLREHGDYTVFSVGYPTTQFEIETHAQNLASIIENLEGIETIHIVAYSLGNLVVRQYLADQSQADQPRASSATNVDRRLRRIVMLAPPNHGTPLARNKFLPLIFGPGVRQLGNVPNSLADPALAPNCEFGIIAGGSKGAWGFNPLLPGDDDGVVPVESTRLEGARDFVVVPVFHSFMLYDRGVKNATLQFLQAGQFSHPAAATAQRSDGATPR